MIFVTAGNHFQGFERLLKKVDEIAHRIPHEIVIQRGYSKYVPQNAKYFDHVYIAFIHKNFLITRRLPSHIPKMNVSKLSLLAIMIC